MGLLAGISPAGAAGVGGISVDGLLDDWGVNSALINNTSSSDWSATQGAWVSEDTGESWTVGPGVGGQDFDVEALYTGFDTSTNMLYVALVTGFDILGETYAGTSYYVGDVFIDFGYDGPRDPTHESHSWDLAFDLSSWNGFVSDDVEDPDSTINAVRTPAFEWSDSPDEPDNPGYESGPLVATAGATETDAVQFAYNDNGPWDDAWDHNVYEFGYHVTDTAWLHELTNGSGSGWTVHWTMSCGNDVLNVEGTPVVPVPGAAFLGLFGGLTVVGNHIRTRRKNTKK